MPPSRRPSGRRGPLRIALLSYRGDPHSGGQGVYVRQLSSALAARGHAVEVLAGQPYPEVAPPVRLTPVPSLDLYAEPDPFAFPGADAFRGAVDVLEYGLMCTAAFPEPLTFSLRAWRHLRGRVGQFDLVHDNQGLGYGLLGVARAGLPTLATVHHPPTIDRDLALARAGAWRRLTLRRWYAFTRMQRRVARRLGRLVTVSQTAARDAAAWLDLPADRLRVVPNGVDGEVFRPRPGHGRIPGRVVTTASADVPLKGLVVLLEALAKVRTERPAGLVVVGGLEPGGRARAAVDRLGLAEAVTVLDGLPEEELAALLASAEAAVVPSLYEGFSLPAVEAMACGTPLVATTAGALPEVVGPDGGAGLLVDPGDPEALAAALARVLADGGLRRRLGRAGRRRVLRRFTWERAAAGTERAYRAVLAGAGPC